MSAFEDVMKRLPEESQELLRFIWDSLPASERRSLQTILGGLPTETNLLRLLFSLTSVQFKLAFGQKRHIAIVGPANSGKSTLYNQLIQTKQDKAEVSPIPGTTKINQVADTGLFAIVDTPGADTAGAIGAAQNEHAMNAARRADFLIILFDATQGIKRSEIALFEELTGLGKPYLVCLNKIDLVRRESEKVILQAASSLELTPDQVLAISAKDGKNVSQVLTAITVTEPQLVAALGQAMPAYRWQLAWRSIVSAASISAVIALTPLPVIDFAPLVLTQSMMVLGIARIYNYKITPKRARELVVTFGLGFLGRTLFQELSKLGGIPGWLLSAAIAASTTVVMGYAAANWFEKGERLSGETINRLTKSVTAELLKSLKSLGKRKPKKEALQAAISSSLDQAMLTETEIRSSPAGENAL